MLKAVFQPLHPLRLPPPDSLRNQTVLITGANTGIGLETARHALSLGASKVILGVRSLEKGERAREHILSTVSTASQTSVEVWHLDLSSFQSVMAFVQKVEEYVDQPGNRLDTAIMNAGLASGKWAMTTDGWETLLQVNGLSTALLSLKLLPILMSSSNSSLSQDNEHHMKKGTRHQQPPSFRPHLVIVSSDMHQVALLPQRTAPNILAALNDKKQWEETQAKSVVERYAATKLLNQYINVEVAKLVPVDPNTGLEKVIVTSSTPGFTKSELLTREDAPFLLKLVQTLCARTPAHGARAIVDAAVRQDAHGQWTENQKVTDPGYLVTSAEGQKIGAQVWREMLDVLKGVDPNLKLDYS